jgi:hypothetical protein
MKKKENRNMYVVQFESTYWLMKKNTKVNDVHHWMSWIHIDLFKK